MNVTEIMAIHPAPWRHRQIGPGIIGMFDANNNQVELFTMLDFAAQVTAGMARPQPQPTPSPQGASL